MPLVLAAITPCWLFNALPETGPAQGGSALDDWKTLLTRIGASGEQTELYLTALTHRSYLNEHPEENADNERLEFLGDAVLGLVTADYLYRQRPALPEGEMTILRAALVCAPTLAVFARQLDLGRYLRLGYGEAENGGRDKTPTLAAALEALLGAVYLECGLDTARQLVEELIAPALVEIVAQASHKDARSEFQVWAQAQLGETPHYRVVAEEGPDHAKMFTLQVLAGDAVWGEGQGSSKQRAAQAAAQAALRKAEKGVLPAVER